MPRDSFGQDDSAADLSEADEAERVAAGKADQEAKGDLESRAFEAMDAAAAAEAQADADMGQYD